MYISPISMLDVSSNLVQPLFFINRNINLDTRKININLNNEATVFYYLHTSNKNTKNNENNINK